MIRRDDRRELGILGLVVLGWGLVAAPLVHVGLVHGGGSLGAAAALLGHGAARVPVKPSGHGHSHGAPANGAAHGAGALEHGLATFDAPAHAVALIALLLALPVASVASLEAPLLAQRFSLEQPQGP
jgi:hypothetical protein